MTPRTTERLKSRGGDADGLVMETLNDTPAPTPAGATPRDRGTTFPEILVTIVLMGFAFSAMIAGIYTMVRTSSASDEQAKVEAVLNRASDALSNWTYTPCPGEFGEAYAPIVSAASASVDWDNSTVQIVDPVLFWDPELNGSGDDDLIEADGGWSTSNTNVNAVSDCDNEDINLTTSRTLQKIRITVTSPDNSITRTLDVVKSNIVADPTTTTTTTTP